MASVETSWRSALPRIEPWPRRFEVGALLCTLLLLVVVFVVLYPSLVLVVSSFEVVSPTGGATTYGLANWQAALTEPGLLNALINTLKVAFVVQAISLPVAVLVAWAIARTDMLGNGWVELLFWISYFLPALVLTSGWILLADPNYGLLNQLLAKLPFIEKGPFNIYSFWSIVFVHLTGVGMGAKVMLLVPSFRNMDASLEEASRMSGVGVLGTLVRIVIPAMAPAVFLVLLASLIRSFEAFEVELVLGSPIRFQVYSTKVYGLINQSPVNYGAATALSMLVLLAMLPLVFLQLRVGNNRSYATVSGRTRVARTRLGRWRWPVTIGVFTVALLATVVPVGSMLMGSFMGLFGYFNAQEVWTLRHWSVVLQDPKFFGSLVNTLILAGGTTIASVFIYGLIAYIAARTRYAARGVFDVLTWVPLIIPGIVLGVGFLVAVLQTPFLRPLYGTHALLIVVSTVAVMTISMQLLKANMLQLSFDLEEASWMSGASWWRTLRSIVVPLIAPAIVTAAVMSFATAARQVSVIVPLSSGRTEPLAVLQLGYLLAENRSAAAVVGTVTVSLTIVAALLARRLGAHSAMGR
jgi:iron(III) transport system permease protein